MQQNKTNIHPFTYVYIAMLYGIIIKVYFGVDRNDCPFASLAVLVSFCVFVLQPTEPWRHLSEANMNVNSI